MTTAAINHGENIATLAKRYGWSEIEMEHALDNVQNKYGDECVIQLLNGRAIHTPAFPEDCYYVRVVQAGYELMYWDSEEWREDPLVVMGAIMGCAHGSPKGGVS